MGYATGIQYIRRQAGSDLVVGARLNYDLLTAANTGYFIFLRQSSKPSAPAAKATYADGSGTATGVNENWVTRPTVSGLPVESALLIFHRRDIESPSVS